MNVKAEQSDDIDSYGRNSKCTSCRNRRRQWTV